MLPQDEQALRHIWPVTCSERGGEVEHCARSGASSWQVLLQDTAQVPPTLPHPFVRVSVTLLPDACSDRRREEGLEPSSPPKPHVDPPAPPAMRVPAMRVPVGGPTRVPGKRARMEDPPPVVPRKRNRPSDASSSSSTATRGFLHRELWPTRRRVGAVTEEVSRPRALMHMRGRFHVHDPQPAPHPDPCLIHT